MRPFLYLDSWSVIDALWIFAGFAPLHDTLVSLDTGESFPEHSAKHMTEAGLSFDYMSMEMQGERIGVRPRNDGLKDLSLEERAAAKKWDLLVLADSRK